MLTLQSIEGLTPYRVDQDVGRGAKGNYFTEWSRFEELPRLKRQRTVYSRLGLPDEEAWFADGAPMGSLQLAIDALNAAPLPELTIPERVILNHVSDGWMALPDRPEHIRALADKGMVEFERYGAIRLRRTELARQLLGEDA